MASAKSVETLVKELSLDFDEPVSTISNSKNVVGNQKNSVGKKLVPIDSVDDDVLDDFLMSTCKATPTEVLNVNNATRPVNAIAELLENELLDMSPIKMTSKKFSDAMKVPVSRSSMNCFPVILSGGNRKVCSNLLCAKCDHAVLRIENSKWNDACDYLFFRLNVPDVKKLKTNTISSNDHVAYCCQCSWISVSKDINLSSNNNDLRWHCAGH